MRCYMRILICIILMLTVCTSVLQSAENYNNVVVNTQNRSKYEAYLSYGQWCSLIDSMIDLGKLKMANKKIEQLLEKGRELNKEKKVYSKLNKLYKNGNTLYMMIRMNKRTHKGCRSLISCYL